MAQRTIVVKTSDLSGEDIDDQGRTISFSYDGSDYTIDLTDDEADVFDDAIQKYIDAGSKVSGRRGARKSAASNGNRDYDPKEVRAWATSQGIDVPARGRIPAELLDQYKAAN